MTSQGRPAHPQQTMMANMSNTAPTITGMYSMPMNQPMHRTMHGAMPTNLSRGQAPMMVQSGIQTEYQVPVSNMYEPLYGLPA